MKLTFLDTNTIREISNEYIVKDSIKYEYQLLKDLSPSSNKLTFQITKDCPAIEDIISAKKDVKVEGDFVGYLSNNYTWTITDSGEKALSLTIEDVGTRLLKKSIDKPTLFKGRCDEVLNQICNDLDIVREDLTIIDKNVCFVGEGRYSDILSNMLRECGYTYYFTNEGKLAIKKFDFSETVTYTVDKTNLYSHNGKSISLTKKVKQYGLVDVSWKSLETLENVYIYKDITGSDSTHPYCYIRVDDTYPQTIPSYVEAVNLNDSREVAYVENIVPEVSYTGNIEWSITQHSPTSLAVSTENKQAAPSHLTKLQCRGDLTVYSAINNTIAGEADFEKYETEAICIHSKEDIEEYSNLLANYYKYCNQTYTFYSTLDMELGNVCNLKDESFSGLNVTVYLIGKKTANSYFEYTAVATSNFDIDNATSEIITKPVVPPQKGDDGETPKTFIVNLYPNTFIKDLRKSGNQKIAISISSSGYEGEIGVTVNAGTLGEATVSNGIYVNEWYLPYNINSATLTATLEGANTQIHNLSAIDVTEYDIYFGTNPPSSGLIDGDSYFDREHLYVYENGSWSLLSNASITTAQRSEICAKAQKDVLDTIQPGTVVSSEFAYIMNIITDLVTASQITMTNQGIIQSSGINDSTIDGEGFLTEDGYRLEGSTASGSGVLRAKNAYINNLNAKNGSLVDVNIAGEISGQHFNSLARSTVTATLTSTTTSNFYYNQTTIDEAFWNAFKSNFNYPAGTYFNATGMHQGANFYEAVYFSNETYFMISKGLNPSLGVPLNRLDRISGYVPFSDVTELKNESGTVLFTSNQSKYKLAKASEVLPSNIASVLSNSSYSATGTVTSNGVTLTANGTDNKDFITVTKVPLLGYYVFSKDGVNVQINPSGYVPYDTSININCIENLQGISATNIYRGSENSNIGTKTAPFKYIYGEKVYGAVFN